MTLEELFQVFDNITALTRFFIISSSQSVIEWGSRYQEIPHQVRGMEVVHFNYHDNEVMVWLA